MHYLVQESEAKLKGQNRLNVSEKKGLQSTHGGERTFLTQQSSEERTILGHILFFFLKDPTESNRSVCTKVLAQELRGSGSVPNILISQFTTEY